MFRCLQALSQIYRRKQIIRIRLQSETGSDYIGLVRLKGLEPARIAAREPKGAVTSVKKIGCTPDKMEMPSDYKYEHLLSSVNIFKNKINN
jgi:hypothetical protein